MMMNERIGPLRKHIVSGEVFLTTDEVASEQTVNVAGSKARVRLLASNLINNDCDVHSTYST